MAFSPKPTSGEMGENEPKSAELAHQTAHWPAMRLHRKGETDTLSREKGRQGFLEIYAEERPGLLSDLWELLPLYPVDANPFLLIGSAVEHMYPDLWAALSIWARKHLLTFRGEPAAWAIDTALETLRSWQDRLKTADTVRKNLPETARKWRAMQQEAGEAIDPETEVWRRNSRRLYVCVDWSHALEMHDTYPVGSPEHFNASGESEAQAIARAFRVEISPWNRAGGEDRRDFRRRAKQATDEHERLMSEEWTGKPDFSSWHHVMGLAWWQAGANLEMVRDQLASADYNVGSLGDVSGISMGLKNAATFLEIDRRK